MLQQVQASLGLILNVFLIGNRDDLIGAPGAELNEALL
jgi:hypothetical protein